MLFEDPEFGPNEYSIYGENPTIDISYKIQWKRLVEVLGILTRLFSDEMVFTDITQGRLGNCWIVSAIIALTEMQPFKIWVMFDQDKANHKKGKYIIRFYEHGELRKVVVDDLVPCCADTGKPIFGMSNWIDKWWPLLEKAYAKVYGSYLALVAGFTHEAFMDLTGLPSFKYDINKNEADNIKRRLIMNCRKQFPMVASTKCGISESFGMRPNHCYTILRTIQADGYFLINLRNPSGYSMWSGDFSLNSELWTQSIINTIERVWSHFNLRDGSFWMEYADFLMYFDVLYVCNIELGKEKREKNIFKKVKKGVGSKATFYYKVTVGEEGAEVVFGLHQEDERSVGVKECRKYLDLGISVMRLDDKKYKPYCCSKQTALSRDSQLQMFLPQGEYIVVPISSGTSLTRPKNSWKKCFPLIADKSKMHPLFKSAIKDIFRRADIQMEQSVGYKEFMAVYHKVDEFITEEYFNEEICGTFGKHNRLTLNGFYQFFCDQALEDEEETRKTFKWLGYDKDFYSEKWRTVVFTLHSNKDVDLETQRLNEETNLKAWKSMAKLHGEVERSKNVDIYKIKQSDGWSILAHNKSAEVISIKSDFSESSNVNFATGSEKCENLLGPGSWQIIQHLFRKDENLNAECRKNFMFHKKINVNYI
ncbi:unnamed protein product [Blepharisma stoltei]|uniref:Calpain catalytic domain-containing protein n=1 Tax=Blepharisma stoltei TaxID=1481888 RepID=A0AAU9JLU0_9CILI|nr:unnamed protein product [Blepharisma stoltei]